jgi:glutathione S-transferase
VIVLRAKQIPFEVTYIDLTNKPEWFLAISPHGKVPVLKVDAVPLFESNAIAEYLEEAEAPHLHPQDLVARARNRAWTDFLTTFTGGLSGIYYAPNQDDRDQRMAVARQRLTKLEEALGQRGNDGPFFNGPQLSLVDAGYAPFLQRFLYVDQWLETRLLEEFPLLFAWARALVESEVVRGSVPDNFYETFRAGMKRRGFYVGEMMENAPKAANF